MEITLIGSMIDLINFYGDMDVNMDGEIASSEYPDISAYDLDHDDKLTYLEVMQAVNTSNVQGVFTESQLAFVRAHGFYQEIDLASDTTINGILFKGGERLVFSLTGHITQGRIAADTSLHGVYIPAGSSINLYMGRLSDIFPSQDIVVQGLLFSQGQTLRFYETEVLINGTLAQETYVNGVTLTAGTIVEFNMDGTIRFGTLASNTKVGDVIYAGGGCVHFSNGEVSAGVLAYDASIEGKHIPSGSNISFYNGLLNWVVLSRESSINGVELAANTQIELNDEGGLMHVWMPEGSQANIDGLWFQGKWDLFFHENGQVSEGTLAREALIQGDYIPAGSILRFYPDGKLKDLYLIEQATINNHLYEANTFLSFRRNGSVRDATTYDL